MAGILEPFFREKKVNVDFMQQKIPDHKVENEQKTINSCLGEKIMPRERITRRQKDISRLLREKNQIHRDKLKTFKKRFSSLPTLNFP